MKNKASSLKMHKKPHLPEKTCEVCKRPFKWRKKWAEVWGEVKYCSKRCRSNKNTKSNNP